MRPDSESASIIDRVHFLDWSLQYLFSYDVELDLQAQETVGRFPGGVRMNCFSRRDLTRIYNVGRDPNLAGLGSPSISGKVAWGGDEVILRDDDVVVSDIRVAIETDEKETIHMSYNLVGFLGPGGTERILATTGRDSLGTEDCPYEAPFMTAPRFETSSAKYAWINNLQGVGFGRTQFIRNKFRRITCDVYALT